MTIWFVTSALLTSNLSKAHETRESLGSYCLQVVLVYCQPFLRNTLCVPRSRKIAKKTLNPLFWEFNVIQGHWRWHIKNVSLVLVMISSRPALSASVFTLNKPIAVKNTFSRYPYLTPACAVLLGSQLAAIKSTLNAENFVADFLGLFPAISVQFILRMCATARNREKSLKQLLLGFKVIQSHRCWHSYKARHQCLLW